MKATFALVAAAASATIALSAPALETAAHSGFDRAAYVAEIVNMPAKARSELLDGFCRTSDASSTVNGMERDLVTKATEREFEAKRAEYCASERTIEDFAALVEILALGEKRS